MTVDNRILLSTEREYRLNSDTLFEVVTPPPLGTIGNPIVVSDDKDDIDSLFSRPSYHEVQSMFTTPTLQLLHC
jgi:hypothetical protein